VERSTSSRSSLVVMTRHSNPYYLLLYTER
jgi:hypothetical protein